MEVEEFDKEDSEEEEEFEVEEKMAENQPERKPMKSSFIPQNLNQPSCIAYQPNAQGSINNWEELATKFLKKFFPAQRTRQLRREIQSFQQKDGDLFFEAWEHFNELLLKCPHHNLSQEDQVQAFYEGLDNSNKSLVDSACGGMLMEKSSEEAIELFETLSENSQQFPSKGRQGLKGKRHI